VFTQFGSNSGCFVGATRVWIEDGTVAIRDIKVGDSVLSQSDYGGERLLARVTQLYRREHVSIRYVGFSDSETLKFRPEHADMGVWTTDNHPFFVKGAGWRAAKALRPGDQVELSNGQVAWVLISTPVLATDCPEIGWHQMPYDEVFGMLVDFSDWPSTVDGWIEKPSSAEDGTAFVTTVYNIEVEDLHTFYVGKWGVWVHNADCAGRCSVDWSKSAQRSSFDQPIR
jgi:hypothetical protein